MSEARANNIHSIYIVISNLYIVHKMSLLTLVSLRMTQFYSFLYVIAMCAVLHRTMWRPSTYGYSALK